MDGTAPFRDCPREIHVDVRDGAVSAQRDDGRSSGDQVLQTDGVNDQLVRVFSRWLISRHRGWERADVTAFGSLLFRQLLDGPIWDLITLTRDELLLGQSLRLVLSFRDTPFSQARAALPWEYLYEPDRKARPGGFLALDGRLLLSRGVPAAGGRLTPERGRPLRVLVAVSQPTDVVAVDAHLVRTVLGRFAESGVAEFRDLPATTTGALRDALHDGWSPDILHFVGHGRHAESTGGGQIALVDVEGRADWVTGEQFSEIAGGATPRLVLLQSCSTGKEAPTVSFAGVAPQMVRHGVPAVVAMQYDVEAEVATEFARSFYEGVLAAGQIDAATQRARRLLAGPTSSYRDPRLIGMPVVYARQNSGALSILEVPETSGGNGS